MNVDILESFILLHNAIMKDLTAKDGYELNTKDFVPKLANKLLSPLDVYWIVGHVNILSIQAKRVF